MDRCGWPCAFHYTIMKGKRQMHRSCLPSLTSPADRCMIMSIFFEEKESISVKIIIAGDGKVGYTLAEELSTTDHDVVIIDKNDEALRRADEALDVLCIAGMPPAPRCCGRPVLRTAICCWR